MTDARRPPPPFRLSILTGFLGAGKTTLLNRLLRDPALADTLVLINEFGSVGLDHLLMEPIAGDMLVMTSGCLCCSIRGDLVVALEDALRARDNGRIAPFQRVIIETTGLADPAPILHTIMTHPYLRLRFQLGTVVTVVDALVGDATLDAHDEAVKQVALSDKLVLSKADLVRDAAAEEALRARLQALNPSAPLIEASSEEANAERLFFGSAFDPTALGSDARAWLAAEAFERQERLEGHHHSHHGHGHHGDEPAHDVNRHDARIHSFCLRYPRPVSPYAVTLFTELLCSAHGSKLLRFKGLIATLDDPSRPVVVHGVQHVMHPPIRLDSWPDDDHTTRLVFIVQDLDRDFVDDLWGAAAGEPRLDRADLKTQAANPLAPTPTGMLG